MRAPNFFLVGAPKTGTTSLSRYLSEHPEVFFSSPKEPNYWADDFPRLRRFHNMETEEKYLRLFADAREEHIAVGEGSTNYLYSQTAIANILREYPGARIVAMLRNPVDVVYAMHGTLVFAMNENVRDFEKAWGLQAARREGQHIPATCLAGQFLQYRNLANFPAQMTRLMNLVPASQRHVILFDDFVADARGCYARVLEFLGVPDDGRTDFPVANAAKRHRFKAVHRIIRRPPRWLERPMYPIRRFLQSQQSGPLAAVKEVLRVQAQRPPLRPEFVRHLRDTFRDDVAHLGEMLQRDLSHWTDPPSSERLPAEKVAAR